MVLLKEMMKKVFGITLVLDRVGITYRACVIRNLIGWSGDKMKEVITGVMF